MDRRRPHSGRFRTGDPEDILMENDTLQAIDGANGGQMGGVCR
jgi:hypothetical protein